MRFDYRRFQGNGVFCTRRFICLLKNKYAHTISEVKMQQPRSRMTFTLPARPSVLWSSSSQQPHEEMSQSNIIFHHPMQFLTSQSGDKISHCTLSILFSTRLGTMSRKKGFMIELQGLSWKIKNRFNIHEFHFQSNIFFSFK